MSWYFDDKERAATLAKALAARRGTPFRHGMRQIGTGYDCWNLVADVYAEAGLDTSILRDAPRGSLNWGRFHEDSAILRFFMDSPELRARLVRREPETEIMAGDILAIHQGRCCNHLAIAESATVGWHVQRGGTVSSFSIRALRGSGMLHAIFRLKDDQ